MTRPTLTIDPCRQFGSLCVTGTRVTASAVAGQVLAGDSLADTAAGYDITIEQAALCVAQTVCPEGYAGNKHHRDLIDWAFWVWSRLGGWQSGPISEPPVVPS